MTFLNDQKIPFEVNALSAHRTPDAVEAFARGAEERGIRVIIAAAGMAAALPGVIAASTTLPVIGVPIKGMLDGLDAMLSIIQMPPGIPVATVGVNGAMNAAILAMEMLALSDADIAARLKEYKSGLGKKIEKANKEVSPKKTWEGAIGGTLLALGGAVVMRNLFLSSLLSIPAALWLGLLVAVVGQISDLAESVIKRSTGVKDSSNLLPGHGGFLDRFDSYLLLAPVFYYVVVYALKLEL